MESPGLPTFSDAIDAIGMGPFQSRLVLICGAGWMFNGIETLNIAFVMDDIAETFELDSFTRGLVGGAGFLGMLFGAMFWSVFADKHGRRIAFMLSLACVVFAGFVAALSSSVNMLIVLRTIEGFGIGGNIPMANVLLAEFLPTNNRAMVLCPVAGVFWSAGIILVALLGLLLSRALGPGEEEVMWRSVLGLSVVPGAMVLIASWRLVPESPRFLSFVAKHDEGVKVLEEVARVNGVTNVLGRELSQLTTEEERVRLQIESASIDLSGKEGYAAAGGIVGELFQAPTIRRSTISIWVIWFFVDTSYYGLTFLLPKYFKAISGDSDDSKFILSIVLGIVYAPGSCLAIWACTENRLGRVGTIKYFSWLSVALVLTMALSADVIPLFLTVSMATYFIIAVPLITKLVVTPELYSTKHRVVGLACANVLSRAGGLLAPILSEVLYEKGPIWPLAAFGPSMVLASVFSGLIPFETAGRKLDGVNMDDGRETASRKRDELGAACEREQTPYHQLSNVLEADIIATAITLNVLLGTGLNVIGNEYIRRHQSQTRLALRADLPY